VGVLDEALAATGEAAGEGNGTAADLPAITGFNTGMVGAMDERAPICMVPPSLGSIFRN
jgi:hypothetical protein